MRIFVLLLALAGANSVLAQSILSGPVTYQNHSYYLISQATWTQAEAKAVQMGGHLVTINDEAENTFVFNTFQNFGGVNRDLWIGLTDRTEEGVFNWVSGDPSTYRNWADGQPDNLNDEDYAFMIGAVNTARFGKWNDFRDQNILGTSRPMYGVVEVVPEPATVCALTLSTFALLRRQKRQP